MVKRTAATIETRHNPSDGSTTYRVRWPERDRAARAAGAPARPTCTFNTRELGDKAQAYAQRLQALVAANGGATPTPDQLRACGLGWKLPAQPRPAGSPTRPPAARYVTVADACRRYLTWKQKSMRPLSKGSFDKHQEQIRCHIEPLPLGRASIADAQTGEQTDERNPDPDTCLAWQSQLMHRPARPLSVNTIADVRTFLFSVFDWATTTNSGRIPLRTTQNPLRGMETPRSVSRQQKPILHNPAEVATFLRIAYQVSPRFAAVLLVMLVTGLRICEVTCLAPADVDPSRNILHIRRHWGAAGDKRPGRKNGDDGEIPVPGWIMQRILVPLAQHDRELVLANRAGRRWQTEDYYLDQINTLIGEAGIPRHFTTHSMRHTYSNWLKRPLRHPEVLGAALGHRRKTVTGEYIRLTDEDMADIRAGINALVPESAWPDPPPATPSPTPALRTSAAGRHLAIVPEFRAA
jgi:integrase